MTVRQAGWIVVCALLSSSCSGGPQKQFAKQMDQAASYAATMQMVVQTWATGSTPTPYAVDTAQAIGQSVGKLLPQVQSAKVDPRLRAQAVELVKELSAAAALARVHFEGNDKASAGSDLQKLQDIQNRLRPLAIAAGSKR